MFKKLADVLFCVGTMVVVACGGAKAPEVQTAPPTSKSESSDHPSAMDMLGVTGPDTPWAEMSAADKEFYMIGKVLPIAQELFGQEDPERWNSVGCETCHGEEMRELKFKMPAPSMFVVAKEGTPAHKGMMATMPEMVKFMNEKVTPVMGKLLGDAEYTCAGCHPSGS